MPFEGFLELHLSMPTGIVLILQKETKVATEGERRLEQASSEIAHHAVRARGGT